MTLDHHAGKEELQVERHQLFQRHRREHRRGFAAAELGGDRHEARQDLLGNLHPCELLLAAVGIADQGRHVEAEVAQERKGVGRIHRQRREHRKDGAAEVGVGPVLLASVEPGVVDQLDAVFVEVALERMAVVLLLQFEQGAQLGLDRLQLLQGGEAVVTEGGYPGLLLRLQRSHAHHEKFVEVVAEDRAELGLLQQGGVLIEGLGQHSLVEGDPAQLPVDVVLGGNEGRRGGGRGHGVLRKPASAG